MKSQPTEWDKIFANGANNKGLKLKKIYKQLIQLNIKKNKPHTIKKMGRRPKQVFLQRRHTDG